MADIELVIKIPEKMYESVMDGTYCGTLYQELKNGTPLPKHGDLIDKGKFKKWIETQDGDKLMTEYYLDALDAQETIVRGPHDGDND